MTSTVVALSLLVCLLPRCPSLTFDTLLVVVLVDGTCCMAVVICRLVEGCGSGLLGCGGGVGSYF